MAIHELVAAALVSMAIGEASQSECASCASRKALLPAPRVAAPAQTAKPSLLNRILPSAATTTATPATRTVKSPPRPTARIVPQPVAKDQPSRFRAMMAKLLGKKQSGQPPVAQTNAPASPTRPSRVDGSTTDDRTLIAKLLGKKSTAQSSGAVARDKGRGTQRATPPGAVAVAAAANKAPNSLGNKPGSSLHDPNIMDGKVEIDDSLVLLPSDDEREAVGSANVAAIESGPALGDPTAMRMDAAPSDMTTADAAEAGTPAESSNEADEQTLMAEASAPESEFVDDSVVQAALHELKDQSVDHANRVTEPAAQPLAAQGSPTPESEPRSLDSIGSSPRDGDVQLATHAQSEPTRLPPAGASVVNSTPASVAVLSGWTDFIPKDFNQLVLIGIVVLLLLMVIRGMRRPPTIVPMTPEPAINLTRRQEDGDRAAPGITGAMITAVGLAIVAVGAMAVVRGHWGGHPLLYRPGLVVAAVGQVILLGGIVLMAAQASRTATARTSWEVDLIQSQLDRLRGVMPATAGVSPFSSAFAWQPQAGTSSPPNVPGQIAQLKAQLACLAQQLDHLGPSGRSDDRRAES